MWIQSRLMAKTAFFLLLGARQSSGQETPADTVATHEISPVADGLRDDRLKPGQRKIWSAVERIFLEMDRGGEPARPMLHRLWQWAQQSRHAIYVEMVAQDYAQYCSAAEISIEDPGRETKDWTVVIRLNLSVIQAARAKKWIDGSNRSSPLLGVGRIARCAGFLAHELMHAFLIFSDPEYARLYLQYKEAAAGYSRARSSMKATQWVTQPEMQQQVLQIQGLINRIEAPLNAVEAEFWRGLIPGLAHASGK